MELFAVRVCVCDCVKKLFSLKTATKIPNFDDEINRVFVLCSICMGACFDYLYVIALITQSVLVCVSGGWERRS